MRQLTISVEGSSAICIIVLLLMTAMQKTCLPTNIQIHSTSRDASAGKIYQLWELLTKQIFSRILRNEPDATAYHVKRNYCVQEKHALITVCIVFGKIKERV